MKFLGIKEIIMQTKSAGELSKAFWSEKYTCSESIVNALWDIWGEKKEPCPTKYASAFQELENIYNARG